MNIYFIPNLIAGIFCFILGVFVFLKDRKSAINISFVILTTSASIWQVGTSLVLMTNIAEIAIIWCRITYVGAIFIPIATYHFVVNFLKLVKQKKYVVLSYLIGICIFLPLSQSKLFLSGINKYFWGYWFKAGYLHPLFLLFFSFLTMLSFVNLYMSYKRESLPLERMRIKFLFSAFLIAYIGSVDFPADYGIGIYPFGYLPLMFYLSIIAYAIVKYRLLDITVAFTRAGIFIAVYTLVLGLPFAAAVWLKSGFIGIFGTGWWMAPLVLMAVLATAGPFLYIYLERKAEARLLREQKRYQSILKQASLGMTRIRNLQKLLNLITHIVTKAVKITYAAIYIYDKYTEEYVLQVSRDKGRESIPMLTSDNPLIAWLISKRRVLVYDEVKRKMQDTNDIVYKQLEENMRLLYASVIIPSILESKFMGFIVLGEKMSGQIYTTEDLNVFEVLASQAALAIENAQFYEEAKEMQDQISQAEKMATIGTMADGLSHQINNRFYALSLIAGDSIDTIKMTDTSKCTPEVKQMINDVSNALDRIQSNVIQGGAVVSGMLKYSRRGEEGFEALELNQILDGTIEMVQFKVKLAELDIIRNFNHIPKINGNMAQLEEVFFNFIDNAYDAIVERRQTFKEENYRGRVIISANPKTEEIMEISVEDNGIGVRNEDAKKVFTPFFTTKISSRKGTGLGLYVIRRIITDVHKGKIKFESHYKSGTKFTIELPISGGQVSTLDKTS